MNPQLEDENSCSENWTVLYTQVLVSMHLKTQIYTGFLLDDPGGFIKVNAGSDIKTNDNVK